MKFNGPEWTKKMAAREEAAPVNPIRHVRIGVVKVGKRINSSRGNPGRTMCGADITTYDLSFGDWAKMDNDEAQRWNVCTDCHFGVGCYCRVCGGPLAYNYDRETYCPAMNCSADMDMKSGFCDHCATEPCECLQEKTDE